MKLGDVVFYEGERWKVTKHHREYRVCELTQWSLEKAEVPDDLDTNPEEGRPLASVLFNPTTDWPFVTVKIRSEGSGPVRLVQRASEQLAPFYDWVPGDLYRPGGAIFLNPDLRLRTGEVLVAGHRNGSRSRIELGPTFGTIARRKARAASPPRRPGPKNRYDRILGTDPFGDDDE